MRRLSSPLLEKTLDGPCLEKRGAYYWICPPKQGTLEIRRYNRVISSVVKRQLIFIEDYLPGQMNLFFNGSDITANLHHVAEDFIDKIDNMAPVYALQTSELKRVVGLFKRNNLCTNLFLKARKGTMTAIMGPSGCGKSIFIKMLAGCNKPSEGRINVADRPLSEMMNHVGYVPQGDVLLPELTGKSSLHYTLKLFAPFLTFEERQSVIKHVADSLDLTLDTLDMQIGSPEWQGKYPSGGQRRRISLAHELVRCPEIIILDEPTSGLADTDAENVIRLLRKLADSQKMTIISSIHSPNSRMFNKFDYLLLVGTHGRICYYGPIKAAMEEVTMSKIDNPSNLMEAISSEEKVSALVDNYLYCMTEHCPSVQYFPEVLP